MTRRFTFPSRLYGILDPLQCGERPWETALEELLAGGIKMLQLRLKDVPSKEFLHAAVQARRRTSSAGCLLIVNDRVDVALASGADGVHLGQEDLPLKSAREIMGPKIIGISTHDLSQALAAQRESADYIGFGPMFGTDTKQTGYTPRGLGRLREIRSAVGLPIAGIGGIKEGNIRDVWEAGADAAAMISNLTAVDDIPGTVRRILAKDQPSSASS